MISDRPPSTTMSEIAWKVHETRVSLDWTQHELAERAGVSRPSVARIERGDDVSTATLEKVAAALRLRVELTQADQAKGRSPTPKRRTQRLRRAFVGGPDPRGSGAGR